MDYGTRGSAMVGRKTQAAEEVEATCSFYASLQDPLPGLVPETAAG